MYIYYKRSSSSMYVQRFDIDHRRLEGCSMNICIRKCVSLNANAGCLLGPSDCAFTYLSFARWITVHNCRDSLWHFCNIYQNSRIPERYKCVFSQRDLMYYLSHRSVSRGSVLKSSECVVGLCIFSLCCVGRTLFRFRWSSGGGKKSLIPINKDKLNSARLILRLLIFVFCSVVPSGNE